MSSGSEKKPVVCLVWMTYDCLDNVAEFEIHCVSINKKSAYLTIAERCTPTN